MSFIVDYKTVNDPAWIAKVRQRGDGSNMLHPLPNPVIRRFANDGALKRGGSMVLLNQQQQMIVRWFTIGWASKEVDLPVDRQHYGYLHVILQMADGLHDTWDIEDLRVVVERKGTGSVESTGWTFPSGKQYTNAWQVICSGKQMSPVRNRNERGPHYLPPAGSLGALWVGTFGVGGMSKRSPTRRTDLLPFRVPSLGQGGDGAGDSGGGGGGDEGGGGVWVVPNDAQLADAIRRVPGLLR